jgi:hypothetical protein
MIGFWSRKTSFKEIIHDVFRDQNPIIPSAGPTWRLGVFGMWPIVDIGGLRPRMFH